MEEQDLHRSRSRRNEPRRALFQATATPVVGTARVDLGTRAAPTGDFAACGRKGQALLFDRRFVTSLVMIWPRA